MFAALRIEDKGNGVDVSLCVVRLDKPVAFLDAVLDVHGTIQAGINLLHRAFTLEKKMVVFLESGVTPVWEFKAKRSEELDRFDLFLIAHWAEWNEKGTPLEDRNRLAQKSEVSLGKMERTTFSMRYTKLGLRYIH